MTIQDASPHLDQDELLLLEKARKDYEAAQAAGEAAPDAAPGDATPGPEAGAPATPAPAPATGAPATPAPPAPTPPAPAAPAQPEGSAREALRAARHENKGLKEANRALNSELERLRAANPNAGKSNATEMTATEIEDLRGYDPAAAAKVEKLQAEVLAAREKAAKPAATPPPPPTDDFSPQIIDDPVIQGAVDDNPDLSAWQTMKEHQALYAAAGRMNEYLMDLKDASGKHAWATKPPAERFAEVVRRVKIDHGLAEATPAPSPAPTPPAPSPAEKAAAIIAAAPVVASPVTAGGLRGGSSPALDTTDFHRLAAQGASDEDIMAKLGP